MAEGDLLELEHLFGFNGEVQRTLAFHPVENEIIVYSIGSLILVENINDRNSQFFLRGHDNTISTLTISGDGFFIASGQFGAARTIANESPVILWNFDKKAPITQLDGLTTKVNKLDFSSDGNFLAGLGEDGSVIVWDCKDGVIVHKKGSEFPGMSVAWGPVRDSNQGLAGAGKHPSYTLISCYSKQVFINYFDFQISSMSYKTTSEMCQMPSTGLTRQFTCGLVDSSGQFALFGTTSGELCVFNLVSKIFRASIPVSSNGILAVAEIDGSVFVGSGDGKVKKLVGQDVTWSIVAESFLGGKITSISPSSDLRELVCGNSIGCIYRLLSQDLSNMLYSEAHSGPIKDVTYGNRSDQFLAIDINGFIRLWDSNDYVVIFRAQSKARGTACAMGEDGTVLTGWSDNFLRCYDPQTGNLMWEIPNAHRGFISSLYMDQNYILSGSEDGTVRVWARTTHQLLTQFTPNRKTITRVFPDIVQPHQIHVCGLDRIISTIDLKLERKVVHHEIGSGTLQDMTQRKDSENELVTCGLGNAILFWDCDEANPIQSIPFNGQLNCIQISPSGKYLAAGAQTSELYVFDIAQSRVITQGVGHSGAINRLSWAPDEKQIVTVSEDSSVAIWNFYA